MNKEEIIQEIEACYNEDCYQYGECVELNNDECKILLHYIQGLEYENEQLQQKVNQLETNRDEAIEYIEENRDYQEVLIGKTKWNDGKFIVEDILREENIKELLFLLERGKE